MLWLHCRAGLKLRWCIELSSKRGGVGMRILKGLLLLVLAVAALALAAGTLFWLWPQDRGSLERLALKSQAPGPESGLMISHWGVSAVLISDGTTALFVDPFFSRPEGLLALATNALIPPRPEQIQRGLSAAGVDRLAAVLVSHSHYDHAMDAGIVANLTGATLVGSESTLNIGRGAGMAPAALSLARPGEPQAFGDFRVTFIPSRHAGATGGEPIGDITQPLRPPARYLDYKLGGTWSILIEHPQGRLLHHGSAGWLEGALARFQADTVLLGVALVDDLGSYLQHTVDAVGATRVIPVHWDDFTRSLGPDVRPMPLVVDLPAFFAGTAALRPDLEVVTLPIGQPVRLPALTSP